MYPPDALRRFVSPGDLCFDIGAHEGKHTAWLLELGARVIAVEPQKTFWQHEIATHPDLKRCYWAVSDHNGYGEMLISPNHTYMSTLERGYTEQVQAHALYEYEAKPRAVATITLDELIERFGVPAFCKIDVEGHERKVFDGLSQALPALSFEVHDFDQQKGKYCIDSLLALAEAEKTSYSFYISQRESFDLRPLPGWPYPVDLFADVFAIRDPDV